MGVVEIGLSSDPGSKKKASTDDVIRIIILVAVIFSAGMETARAIWPQEARADQLTNGVVQRLERIEQSTNSIGTRMSVLESQFTDLRSQPCRTK